MMSAATRQPLPTSAMSPTGNRRYHCAVSTCNALPGQPGVWRGTTAEERLAPRREKLVQAGFELLGEHGPAGTTVRGVCAHAGLNPRYFYESFADLDELMGAVFDLVMEENTALTLAAIAEAPNR